jgi:hypothetical protein
VNYGSDGGIVSSPNSFARSSLAAATPGRLFKLLISTFAVGASFETHQLTFFFPLTDGTFIDDARFSKATTQLSIRHDGR